MSRVTDEQARQIVEDNDDYLWEWGEEEDIEVNSLHRDLAADLLDARAECERLRAEVQTLTACLKGEQGFVQYAHDGSVEWEVNVADLRAKLAEAVEACRGN